MRHLNLIMLQIKMSTHKLILGSVNIIKIKVFPNFDNNKVLNICNFTMHED